MGELVYINDRARKYGVGVAAKDDELNEYLVRRTVLERQGLNSDQVQVVTEVDEHELYDEVLARYGLSEKQLAALLNIAMENVHFSLDEERGA